MTGKLRCAHCGHKLDFEGVVIDPECPRCQSTIFHIDPTTIEPKEYPVVRSITIPSDIVDVEPPVLFTVYRGGDASGVSGTGRVIDGVLFHTGQVVICWRTDIEASKHGHSSLGIYPSWEAFRFIHIDSHPENDTRIEWVSDPRFDDKG